MIAATEIDHENRTKDQLIEEIHRLREGLASGGSSLKTPPASDRGSLGKFKDNLQWIEDSPISTAIIDLDLNLQFMSPAGAKDLKIDNISDYYGCPYPFTFTFYPESFKQSMARNLAKVKEIRAKVTQEDLVNDIRGEKIWYHSTLVPIQNEHGELDHIMIASVNATAQHQAKNSLKLTRDHMEVEIEKRNSDLFQSAERISHALRGANDGLWDWNLETNEVYYSPRWKSMLGYEDEELEANLNTWQTLVHPDDKDLVLEQITDYLEGRADSFEVEMRMCHKDGKEVVVLSRAFLVNHESNSKPTRIVGTHVDITERTQSEKFIVSTSEILKMIATREPASRIYDAIGLLYESRHPGLRCSMLTLVGNKLMHGGAPSLPKEYCQAVNGLENGPSVGSCGTATYYGKRVVVENIDTDPKWAKIKHVALPHGMRCCWSEPIKNSTGDVLGAFGMYYDYPARPNNSESNDLASAARLAGIIMEREKSEKELNQYRNHLEELVAKRTTELEETKREAEEANKAKSKFLSNMSHELRTPLNAIIGFGQVLESDTTDTLTEEQQEGIGHILGSGEHLLQLINEILDLSQIETGNLSLKVEPIRLDLAISEAIDLVQSVAKKYDITLINETTIHSNTEIYVMADHLRLKQVLINLLSNGIKYNKPGGTVSLGVIINENQHQIVIRDSGIGIKEKDINTLFVPFNRLGAETTKIEGTGIGLTITKHLIEVMNGSLNIESVVGEGSTFTFTMPAGRNLNLNQSPVFPSQFDRNAILAETNVEREEATILYVEDNIVNVKLVQSILRRCNNLRLVIASTGNQGIEMAERELPSLILMDINLPDISGLQALRQLQLNERTAHIPVVGVSADAMTDVVEERELNGFKDYITKPFRIDRLLQVINYYTAVRRDDGPCPQPEPPLSA